MIEKRYSNEGVCIVDHKNKDLIDIDGRDDLLKLAENVDELQEEYELLQEECLGIVNIITDARIYIFEGRPDKSYDTLGDAIDKLQKMAYKEI